MSGKFAYPFIDLAKVGMANAALFISMVIGVFLLCAAMLLIVDKALRPKQLKVTAQP